jgi:hypothetical protein
MTKKTPGKTTTPIMKKATGKTTSNKRELYPNCNEISQREVRINEDELKHVRPYYEIGERNFRGKTLRVRLWPHEVDKLNARRMARKEKVVKEANGVHADPIRKEKARAKGLKYSAKMKMLAKKQQAAGEDNDEDSDDEDFDDEDFDDEDSDDEDDK